MFKRIQRIGSVPCKYQFALVLKDLKLSLALDSMEICTIWTRGPHRCKSLIATPRSDGLYIWDFESQKKTPMMLNCTLYQEQKKDGKHFISKPCKITVKQVLEHGKKTKTIGELTLDLGQYAQPGVFSKDFTLSLEGTKNIDASLSFTLHSRPLDNGQGGGSDMGTVSTMEGMDNSYIDTDSIADFGNVSTQKKRSGLDSDDDDNNNDDDDDSYDNYNTKKDTTKQGTPVKSIDSDSDDMDDDLEDPDAILAGFASGNDTKSSSSKDTKKDTTTSKSSITTIPEKSSLRSEPSPTSTSTTTKPTTTTLNTRNNNLYDDHSPELSSHRPSTNSTPSKSSSSAAAAGAAAASGSSRSSFSSGGPLSFFNRNKDNNKDNNGSSSSNAADRTRITQLEREKANAVQELDIKDNQALRYQKDAEGERAKCIALQQALDVMRDTHRKQLEDLQLEYEGTISQLQADNTSLKIRLHDNEVMYEQSLREALSAQAEESRYMITIQKEEAVQFHREVEQLRTRQLLFDEIMVAKNHKKYDEITYLRHQLAYYERQLSEADSTIDNVRNTYQSTNAILMAEVKSLEETKVQLSAITNECQHTAQDLTARVALLEGQVKRHNDSRIKMSEILSRMEVLLSEKEDRLSTLQNTNQELSIKALKLEKQLQRVQQNGQ